MHTFSHRYYNHNEVKIGKRTPEKKALLGRYIHVWHCVRVPIHSEGAQD